MRRRFQTRLDRLNLPTAPDDTAPVSEEDISTLPNSAQRYLRFSATSWIFLDEHGRVVDFSSIDRWANLPGGLIRARWTTPIDGWFDHGGRWLPTGGHAIWHLDGGEFEYVRGRFVPEGVAFNIPPRVARI